MFKIHSHRIYRMEVLKVSRDLILTCSRENILIGMNSVLPMIIVHKTNHLKKYSDDHVFSICLHYYMIRDTWHTRAAALYAMI